MAYRRAIAARTQLLHQHQRTAPSFSHIHRDDEENGMRNSNRIPENRGMGNYFRHRLFRTGNSNLGTFCGSRNLFDRSFAIPAGYGMNFVRNMSSLGDSPADNIKIVSDLIGDKAVETAAQVAPVANEVAVAAAGSSYPVAGLQYLIEYVHFYTGFNWWASIVLTTILIRCIHLPLMINQVKSISKFELLVPRLEKVLEELKRVVLCRTTLVLAMWRAKQLFKEYRVTIFTPFKGLLYTGSIFTCFYFATQNMAANVSSLKDGGTLWFTDLTTPDSMYIFPVLTAFTIWIAAECNSHEGMEGTRGARICKNISRIFAALTVSLTTTLPKAVFCYWITSNLFSITYRLALKNSEVKKFLGIPIIPVPPHSATNQKPSSMSEMLKTVQAAREQLEKRRQQGSQQAPTASSSPKPDQRILLSSVPSKKKIKSLEKGGKGKKKGRKN